ncbi:MAG: GNAT family N-acetyltransferase [Proteobacteria bacterium]|nr:GNAT family N-acetyltransferase [Pseudomonadota bacterium]
MSTDDLRIKAEQEILILAIADNDLIGCGFASLREDCVYVSKLAVAAARRGQGVARAIMQAVEAVAAQNTRAFLELETRMELMENHVYSARIYQDQRN